MSGFRFGVNGTELYDSVKYIMRVPREEGEREPGNEVSEFPGSAFLKRIKNNVLVSVFSLDFRWSLDSSPLAQASLPNVGL